MMKAYNDPWIDKTVEIQDFVVVGKDGLQPAKQKVHIASGTRLLTGCVIYNGVQIGQNCLVADYANIRENCTLGNHTVIGRHVCIENNTHIGNHVLIETQTHITGNCFVEDYVFIGPNVTTMNDKKMCHPTQLRNLKSILQGPTFKKGCRIGSAACILPGVTIGEEAIVGAGAVVVKDVRPRTIVIKCPAEEVKKVPENELLQLPVAVQVALSPREELMEILT